MKKGFWSLLTVLLSTSLLFVSCDKNPVEEYKGENTLLLRSDKSFIYDAEDENGEIVIEAVLTTALDEDLTLEFAIEPSTEVCSLEKSKITIAKGETKGLLTLKAKGDGTLKDAMNLKVVLKKASDSNVKLKEEFSFQVKPLIESLLTDAQKELVEHYKKNRITGLYTSLLGKSDVTLSVKYPGNENFVDFNADGEKEFKSFTMFTLSEKATKEKMVLKMEHNAMGLNDFLYAILSNMTHKNEYWEANPLATHVKRLINFDKFKDFNVVLDDIATEGHGLKFVSTLKNSYGDEFQAVPFTYTYSAWDEFLKFTKTDAELKQFISEQEEEAKSYDSTFDISMTGGTLSPAYYLNKEDIVENQFEDKTRFTKTEVAFDHNTFMLTFTFCLAYDQADDYMQFKAAYQLKK